MTKLYPAQTATIQAKQIHAIKRAELVKLVVDAVLKACDKFESKAMSARWGTYIESLLPGFIVSYDKCKYMGTISLRVWHKDHESALNFNGRFSVTLPASQTTWNKQYIVSALVGYTKSVQEIDTMKANVAKTEAHVARYNELVAQLNACTDDAQKDGVYFG